MQSRTSSLRFAISSSTARTRLRSLSYDTPMGIVNLAVRPFAVQFAIRLLMSLEFGTIITWLSNVCTHVPRAPIRITSPCVTVNSDDPLTLPTSMKSPSLTGPSHKITIPATKLDTMFCNPNPMPTPRAPPLPADCLNSSPLPPSQPPVPARRRYSLIRAQTRIGDRGPSRYVSKSSWKGRFETNETIMTVQ